MARNFANILTAIWRDPDFRRLACDEQGTYLLLATQGDITAAGVLPLTIERWAGMSRDGSVDRTTAALQGLVDGRFIFVDVDTQELLVRTFVKWDGGYPNPKRRPVILRAAQEVYSPELRAALAVEFVKLGLPTAGLVPDGPPTNPPDRPSGRHTDSHSTWQSGRASVRESSTGLSTGKAGSDTWDQPTRQLEIVQLNSLSDSHADSGTGALSPSEGLVVSKALVVGPLTTNPNPHPRGNAIAEPAARAAGVEPTEEEGEAEARREDPNPETELVTRIRTVRPEWSERSILRALRDDDVATRPWPVIEHAALAIARDHQTQAPGRLRGDGPWWANAAEAVGARSAPNGRPALAVHPYSPGTGGFCYHDGRRCLWPPDHVGHRSDSPLLRLVEPPTSDPLVVTPDARNSA